MPKKTPVVKQKEWLDDYEKGTSVAGIARKAHRDSRTVGKAIDQARRQRDAGLARAELMKEALSRHHGSLLDTLGELITGLAVPAVDTAPLPWQGGDGVLQAVETAGKGGVGGGLPPADATLALEKRSEWALLKEHLKRDRLWKDIANYRKALAAYQEAQMTLQSKTVSLLSRKTGYKVVESKDPVGPPSVYVETTGSLFYGLTVRKVTGDADGKGLERRIVADPNTGEVRYGTGSTLAKAPGEEGKCRGKLLEVLRLLKESSEAGDVLKKYTALQSSTAEARKAAEEICLLGLVPGQCRICQRLGL